MRSRPSYYGAFTLVFIFTFFGIVGSYAQEVKPVPIERALPQYPFELRQANITGKVIVEFVVTTKGDVTNAFAVRSTHRGFEPAAIAAVSRWKFKPGSNQGRAVNTRMQIPVIFNLDGVRGPQIFRALEVESWDKLPDEMRYHHPPRNLAIQSGAYPYDSLLNNERKVVLGGTLISAQGKVVEVLWKSEPISNNLKQATMAMLDTATLEPATLKKKAVSTMMWFRVNFNPLNGDIRISDSAAAILKKLRLEGDTAQFTKSRELDAKIKPLERAEPLFPRLSQVEAETGKALIEFYIDQAGHAQLPRIVSSSEPAFGYSACQAIAQWKFKPPLKDGQSVVVKVRVPVNFKRE